MVPLESRDPGSAGPQLALILQESLSSLGLTVSILQKESAGRGGSGPEGSGTGSLGVPALPKL